MDYASDEDLFDDEPQSKHEPVVSENKTSLNVTEIEELQRITEDLRRLLQKIPPPPACQQGLPRDIEALLKAWEENKDQFTWTLSEKTDSDKYKNLGINLNVCSGKEELEGLWKKYQERFICSETESSIARSLFEESKRSLTASEKKRARLNGWTVSPGRRLSHLARRRTTFTPQRLKRALFISPTDDKKKSKTPKESPNVVVKKTTTLSTPHKKRLLWAVSDALRGHGLDATDPKSKAVAGVLFERSRQSLLEKGGSLPPERVRELVLNVLPEILENSQEEKKRRREEEPSSSPNKRRKETPPDVPKKKLSKVHERKLLWAVTTGLKERNEGKEKVGFVFKSARTLWLNESENMVSSLTASTSTSDRMLAIVRSLLNDTCKS